jgi:hypothetical protein
MYWPAYPARCPVRVLTERCSPWPAAFPPRSPSALPDLRSIASSVLCRRSTPCRRTRGSCSLSPSPTDPPPCGSGWPQGLSVLACPEGPQFRCMRGVYDSAVPASRSRISRFTVLPSGSPDTVGASDFGYFGAHQLQGYPACICPCPTLWVRRYRRPHMARGQDGSLLLSCMTLSFTTSRRFIPTHPGECACPTSGADRTRQARRPLLLLSVVCFRAVLSRVMLVMQGFGDG